MILEVNGEEDVLEKTSKKGHIQQKQAYLGALVLPSTVCWSFSSE